MTLYVIHEEATGSLVTTTSNAGQLLEPEVYAARRHIVSEWADGADVGTTWNPVLRQFVVKPVEGVLLSRYEVKKRLQTAERIAIRIGAESGDRVAEDILDLINTAEGVNLQDPDVHAMIGYLVVAGYLTEQRGGEFLTP